MCEFVNLSCPTKTSPLQKPIRHSKKILLFSAAFIIALMSLAQPASWKVTGIGGGGAFFRPSINPGNTDEYYVPTDMGVLFHSTDFGQSYSELGFLQLRGGAGALVRFTNNANILYAVGGNGAVNKSTNGGTNWSVIPCISGSTNPDVQESVVSLFVDYNNPLELAFATRDGLYFSQDGGNTLMDITQTSPAYQYIGGCLFTGDSIFMGTPGGVLVSTDGGTSFALAALTGLVAGYDIIGFAAAKQGSTIRFFCSTMPTGTPTDEIYGSAGGWQTTYVNNVYTLDYNLGTVWNAASTGITLPSSSSCYPCDYIVWMGMAANDINTVYAGGVNGNAQPMLVKTTNAGASWAETFLITTNQNIYTGYMGQNGDRFQWYDGFCGMDVCQSNSSRIVLSNMGCVHMSTDGGNNWYQTYVNPADENPEDAPTPDSKFYRGIGIENTSNWLVTWADTNDMVFSLTDIGCLRSSDAGVHWQFADALNFSYNTMYCAVATPGMLYGAASNIHDMYTNNLQDEQIDNTVNSTGEVMYSTDKGFTWTTLQNFGRPVYWIEIDKTNPNRMYASVVNHAQGLGGIYMTNDLQDGASSAWTQLSAPPRTEGHPAKIATLSDGKMVCTFGARMTDYSASPAGKFTQSSGVFIYDPSLNSWTDVTDLTSLNTVSGTYTGKMGWYCNDIYVDPNDAYDSTWYVGVSAGWGWTDAAGNATPNDQGALMKTTNRGNTWTKLLGESNGLSAGSGVFSATMNPANPDQLYVTTTEDGLWMCSDINSGSPSIIQVSDFQFGFPLRVLFNPFNQDNMWVTTFGNGVHVGNLISTGIAEVKKAQGLRLYPNPASGGCTVLVSGLTSRSILEVTNLLGQSVLALPIYPQTENYFLNTDSWQSGVYVISINGSSKSKLVITR